MPILNFCGLPSARSAGCPAETRAPAKAIFRKSRRSSVFAIDVPPRFAIASKRFAQPGDALEIELQRERKSSRRDGQRVELWGRGPTYTNRFGASSSHRLHSP